MEKNINLNQKIIINLIYYFTVYIFSLFYLTTINHSHIIDIKGFSFSYLLGILVIVFSSLLFTYKIYNNIKVENINENKENKKYKEKKEKNKISNKITLFFIVLITFYIIVFINFINYPLNLFNVSTGIIASTVYSSKILLYSGTAIALNIFIENKNNALNKKIVIITIIKLLLYISLGLLFLKLYKYKGLLYTISTLELIHLITNIILIKIKTTRKTGGLLLPLKCIVLAQ